MSIRENLTSFYKDFRSQDFAFFMVAAYLVFSYLRPQVIYPWLNFFPWTQASILAGLAYLLAKQRVKINAPSFLSLMFAFAATVSSFYSFYPEYSFSKLDIPFIWFVEVLFFTNAVKNLTQFRLLLILFFLILFKMSFFGARVWALRGFGFASWGISGPPGYFQNSGEFSLLMAMLAVMSLAFILSNKPVNRWYFLLPVTAIMSVLGASSRGGQLALLLGLIWINFFILKLKFKTLLPVIILAFLSFQFLPEKQKERFSSMGSDGTSSSRLTYWSAGIDMFYEHPSFGVGYYAFPHYFDDFYGYLKEDGGYSLRKKEVSHNSLVQVASTMGLFGFLVYVSMHFLCILNTRKVRQLYEKSQLDTRYKWVKGLSIGLDSALLTYFVGAFFMSVAFYPYIYLLLMFSFVLKKSVTQEIELSREESRPFSKESSEHV